MGCHGSRVLAGVVLRRRSRFAPHVASCSIGISWIMAYSPMRKRRASACGSVRRAHSPMAGAWCGHAVGRAPAAAWGVIFVGSQLENYVCRYITSCCTPIGLGMRIIPRDTAVKANLAFSLPTQVWPRIGIPSHSAPPWFGTAPTRSCLWRSHMRFAPGGAGAYTALRSRKRTPIWS